MPDIIADNRMFNRGWKFNMLEHSEQFNKQMWAIACIFMMMAFVFPSFAFEGPTAFNVMVLIYSMIAMLSFLNLSYVRDFDAI
jgi:hypothetical protein